MSDCLKCGNHHTLDASIDNGKWFAAKVLKESPQIQATGSSISLPFIPSTSWREFPSHCIPSLFNYGHVYYYALESLANDLEDIDDGLGHMTDNPMKNGRKYVDSGFVHDVMDTISVLFILRITGTCMMGCKNLQGRALESRFLQLCFMSHWDFH